MKTRATPETEAADLLDAHHPQHTPPTPILAITQAEGIKVVWHKHPTSAVAFHARSATGEHVIGLNTRQGTRSQHWALAHTLGHALLHGRDLTICHDIRLGDVDSAANATWEQEAHATRFAAELLLPADLVFAAAGAWLGAHPYNNPDRDGLVRHLAEVFAAPSEAVAFRLIDLAVLSA